MRCVGPLASAGNTTQTMITEVEIVGSGWGSGRLASLGGWSFLIEDLEKHQARQVGVSEPGPDGSFHVLSRRF